MTGSPVPVNEFLMNARVEMIFQEAGKLTAEERHALARLLLESLQGDASIDAAWSVEAERRWGEHVASGAATLDAFEALDEVRAERRA